MARGKLRIYLGAAPGVGKTFAMLNEGRRRFARGTDVVVGFVETHGRANTAEQLGDLEVVPRRRIEYRGTSFEEMDIDALLARKPRVALVDELAHTNVPGSRNEKRWQDVEELLERGHRRHLDRQHPAPRVDERRGPGDHRHRAARDDPGRGRARRGPGRARSTRRPKRCGAAWPTATSTRPRRSTPRSPTTSARATSARCASSPSCGSRTGSTRRSRSTGSSTASPAPGRPASGCWWRSPVRRAAKTCCGAPPGWRCARAAS